MCDRNQQRLFQTVKDWLQKHSDWLLIFDNVEDLTYVNELLPSVRNGYVLLTTLSHATGEIIGISLESMEPEEGALFLLRRAKILEFDALLDQASIANRDTAVGISRVLAGLPLALDQAGAYIEDTSCGLSGYLDLCQQEHARLLEQRGSEQRDSQVSRHPDSVTATISLALKKVAQVNPAACELLLFCAFLAPDPLPEDVFTQEPRTSEAPT